ncbi:MAG: collagen binding domain-containing protein [Oscillospiraceae bacterium]
MENTKFGNQSAERLCINKRAVYAELKYAGQEVKITSTAVSINNKRQKAVIRLLKYLEKDEIFNLGNTSEYTNIKFGLFATEGLTAADGSEIPAEGLLEVISVDENGNGIFTADIPVGAKLYVKETATDGHYILSDEKYPVEFTYSGQDISSVQLIINDGKVIENRIIRGRIDGIKTDEDLNPIEKAVFGLFKPDETVFTESTALAVTESEENGAFSFTGIPYGKWIIKSCPAPTVMYCRTSCMR